MPGDTQTKWGMRSYQGTDDLRGNGHADVWLGHSYGNLNLLSAKRGDDLNKLWIASWGFCAY